MTSLAVASPPPPPPPPNLISRFRSPPSSLPVLLPLKPIPHFYLHSRGNFTAKPYSPLHHRRPLALHASSTQKGSDSKFAEWDSLTAKFAGAANVPFLLLQLPQIVLNARNLLAGDKAALFAVPWLGMLTGLLGNLSLLSYFAKKKETEAVVVQTLGVVSTYAVIVQLAMAESMPLPHFLVTSAVVGSGLVLNFMNYFGWLNEGMWRVWEDFITVGGLSVLPQVIG